MNEYATSQQHYCVAEEWDYRFVYKEEDLVNWWLSQSECTPGLRSTEGENIIVMESGCRNDGPGPDIRQACISLDDVELSGDIEMHLHAKDWFQHGHQMDASYNRVILHVICGGEAGPDIPTLMVDPRLLVSSACLATRGITQAELLQSSWYRFSGKSQHLRILAAGSNGYSPLLLGMLEILLAGKHRMRSLQTLAVKMGLDNWPDARPWRGSRQVYPHTGASRQQFECLVEHADLFDPALWKDIPIHPWREWDHILNRFRQIHISRNQCREWLVNVLAPWVGGMEGFSFWIGMPTFRQYGSSKKVLRQLNVDEINTIADQQALLVWAETCTNKRNCPTCPLTHSHQTLRGFN